MKIRIYGSEWEIIEAEPSACEMAGLDGWCDPSRRLIFIDPTLDEILRREVILHEIVHALFRENRWPTKKLKEERIATWIGKALSVFMHENKAFVQKHLL